MEAKVSLVVTCYNKVDTVPDMLASILHQKWNKIEVILVDDGSTDGTSDVLTLWQPKLEKRGYEVKIIRQQNTGVSAAAKTGMENITGEYACLIDGDDELDSGYVSTMANWLTKHTDYDLCKCTYKMKQLIDGQVVVSEGLYHIEDSEIETHDMQKRTFYYILRRIVTMAWVYMTRTAYLHRCGLPKNYHTDIRTNQESNFVVPLMAGGGKVKYFPDSLYIYNRMGEGADFSRHYTIEKWDYLEIKEKNWFNLLKITIQSLDTDPEFKKKALFLADFSYFYNMCDHAYHLMPSMEFSYFKSAIALMNQYYSSSIDANIFKDRIRLLKEFVIAKTLNLPLSNISEPKGKVIAYGVLGRRGKEYLNLLNNTSLMPEQLWDINGDNIIVKKPDFSSLKSEDILIIFPKYLVLDVICQQISFEDACMHILSKEVSDLTLALRTH